MQQLVQRLIRLYFTLASKLAPEAAVRHSFRLFCTPLPRRAPAARDRVVLDAAESFTVPFGQRRLAGYRWRPAEGGSETPAVLLVHGWASRASRLTRWVAPLLDAGYEVVAFDGPAHGDSGGRRTSLPEYAAALAGVAAAQGPFCALVGHSFGAACIASAVAGGDLFGNPEIAVGKLVLIAGPDRITDVLARFADTIGLDAALLPGLHARIAAVGGQPVEVYSVSSLLTRTAVPVLVVHDRHDEEIPHADAAAVAAASPAATLLTTEGLGHHRIIRDGQVIRQVVEFLGQRDRRGRRQRHA